MHTLLLCKCQSSLSLWHPPKPLQLAMIGATNRNVADVCPASYNSWRKARTDCMGNSMIKISSFLFPLKWQQASANPPTFKWERTIERTVEEAECYGCKLICSWVPKGVQELQCQGSILLPFISSWPSFDMTPPWQALLQCLLSGKVSRTVGGGEEFNVFSQCSARQMGISNKRSTLEGISH